MTATDRRDHEVETLTERYAAVRRAYGMEAQERGRLELQLRGAVSILNEAMGDPACVDWPDDARTYIARAAAALEAGQ